MRRSTVSWRGRTVCGRSIHGKYLPCFTIIFVDYPREKERPGIDGYVEASNATEALTCGVYHLRDLLRNACFQ